MKLEFRSQKLECRIARLALFVSSFFLLHSAFSQTAVLFPLAQMTGTTNDTTITIRPINNPVDFRSQIYWLAPAGIQLRTTNGAATTNLIPNDYTVTIAGVPGSWRISVADTNIILNAADIGNLTTYIFTNRFPGVLQLLAGSNITLSPADGKGVVTVSASGSGGGSATNAYQLQVSGGLLTLSTNQTTFVYTLSAISQTNGYPWGALYDAAGTARNATNGFPWGTLYDTAGAARNATNGYPWSTLYDAAGSAIAVTNGYLWSSLYDSAGSATAATNGYPWGALYDLAGAAHSATNGYPWSVLYDAAGTAQSATNGIGIPSGLAAFRSTNTLAPTNVATASTVGLVKVDNSTITVAANGTISATTGGGGTVTSVGLSMPGEFSVSGSPVTGSGAFSVTRAGDANFLGFGATNIGFIKVTNTVSISGPAIISALIVTNGFTNSALTASTLLEADSNKKLTSIPNAFGAVTNDGAGNFGYVPLLDASALKASQHIKTDVATNLISSEDATGYTNSISWTHDGIATNLTAAFNGTLQSFTVTNGPDVFIAYAGANGSVSYRFTTNVNLHFSYQPKWLAGSNSVITNGVLSLTSYGGTNAAQIEAAIGENQ